VRVKKRNRSHNVFINYHINIFFIYITKRIINFSFLFSFSLFYSFFFFIIFFFFIFVFSFFIFVFYFFIFFKDLSLSFLKYTISQPSYEKKKKRQQQQQQQRHNSSSECCVNYVPRGRLNTLIIIYSDFLSFIVFFFFFDMALINLNLKMGIVMGLRRGAGNERRMKRGRHPAGCAWTTCVMLLLVDDFW